MSSNGSRHRHKTIKDQSSIVRGVIQNATLRRFWRVKIGIPSTSARSTLTEWNSIRRNRHGPFHQSGFKTTATTISLMIQLPNDLGGFATGNAALIVEPL